MPMARSAHEVERAVRSVLAQDFADFELLIGDETGAARPLVDALADPRVDYRHNPTRLGFSRNHVALLDRARGRYVAVLHDDDRWEPTFLSRLVSVLERHPDVAMACCRVVIDRGAGNDLQFFLSAVEAGWPLYFLDTVLTAYTMHRGQSGAWRGPDAGLAVADDVLTFWDGWLAGRPERLVALTARQRARWHLRRARALLLSGRTTDARQAVARAEALGGDDLPGLRPLRVAVALPNPLVRSAVALKRAVTEGAGSLRRR
jgi:glycosyltransferase involved in cell wall biosynthesis